MDSYIYTLQKEVGSQSALHELYEKLQRWTRWWFNANAASDGPETGAVRLK